MDDHQRSREKRSDSDRGFSSDLESKDGLEPLCHLDAMDDPCVVLAQLRSCLHQSGAVLLEINDFQPSVALDAIFLLVCLEQDLNEEQPSTKVIFRTLTKRSECGHLIIRVCKMKGHRESHDHSHPLAAIQVGGGPISPSNSSLSRSVQRNAALEEVKELASTLLSKLENDTFVRVSCSCPRALIIALRAIKIARKTIRSNTSDLFVCPHLHMHSTAQHGSAKGKESGSNLVCLDVFVKQALA